MESFASGRSRCWPAVAVAVAAMVSTITLEAQAAPVELELILAVDTSLSVDDAEFRLQMQGLANAFRSDAVVAAISAAGDRGIAVSLVQWSDRTQQRVSVGWSLIRNRGEARAFADRVARVPRHFDGAGTALAAALQSSVFLFAGNGFEGQRRVIDISGDGIDNRGPLPQRISDPAVAAGVTVNGLAILNEDPYLDIYYANNVIGGTGAFVMTAADYQDFAAAIIRKLVREIAAPPLAERPGRQKDAQSGIVLSGVTDRCRPWSYEEPC